MYILLAVERDTPCMYILLAAERINLARAWSPIHIGLDCIKTPELSKSCFGTFNNYLTAALFYDIKKKFLGHLCIRAGTVVVLNLPPPVISY